MSPTTFDTIIDIVGPFGRFQITTWLYCLPTTLFLVLANYNYVFFAYNEDHWCHVTELENANWTKDEIRNISAPLISSDGTNSFEKCLMYTRNYSRLATLSHEEALEDIWKETMVPDTMKCDSWNYEGAVFENTVVSEFNLVCDDKFLRPTIQVVYLIGIMSSTFIFGPISDVFGRCTAILIGQYLAVAASYGTYFSPNYLVFIIFNYFIGLGMMGAYFSAIVLLNESVGKDHRSTITLMFDMGVPLASLVSATVGYFIRDWRLINLVYCIGMTTLLISPWLICESPRWLLVKKKTSEAKKALMFAAKRNNRNITNRELDQLIEGLYETETIVEKSSNRCVRGFQKIFALWRTPEMRSRSFKIYCCWFVIASIGFGVVYLAVKLPVNVFLITAVFGVQKFFEKLAAIWILKKFPRRLVFSGFFALMTLSMMSFIFIPKDLPWLSWVMLIVVKITTVNFSIIYLYTAELFPTEYRSIGTSVGSFHARLGAMSATYIADYLDHFYSKAPGILFTIFAGCATIASFLLPETKHENLPDTVNDVELWRRNSQRRKHIEDNSTGLQSETLMKNDIGNERKTISLIGGKI